MTETEFMASNDLVAMLRTLGVPLNGTQRFVISDRKLRLFACACTRSVWHLLTDERSRKAVEVAERFADGEATCQNATKACLAVVMDEVGACANAAAFLHTTPILISEQILGNAGERRGWPDGSEAKQAALLRDIVGNPWQPLTLHEDCGRPGCEVLHQPAWLTPQVLLLANQAYEERLGRACDKCQGCGKILISCSFPKGPQETATCKKCHGTGRISDGTLGTLTLAVLADALEEAGCEDERILSHFRDEECDQCDGRGNRGHCKRCRGHYNTSSDVCPMCPGSSIVQNPCKACAGRGKFTDTHVRGCHILDCILGKE